MDIFVKAFFINCTVIGLDKYVFNDWLEYNLEKPFAFWTLVSFLSIPALLVYVVSNL